jgi:predicted  nucleic acid-binding Zn-ribbon protein
VESGFLGLSRDQSIDVQGRDFVPTTTEMQIANRKILNEASTDPNVVTIKALPSGGAFEKTPETALDIDIVSERDYLPVDALDAAARQAVEDDQKSWFFARRIRPEVGRTFPQFFTAGTEIYFDTGKRKGDQIIEDVEDYLLDNDYYGYTLIVDPRDADKILGMRVLQIPQYDGSAEKYAKMSQDAYATESRNEFQRFRDLGQRLTDEFGQVKDTSPGYFDVNAKSLEETQGYLAQLASRERGASLEDLREDFYGFKPAQERFKRYTGISEPAYPQEGAAGRGSSATNAAAAATTGAGIAALAGPGEAEALEVSDEGIESLPRDPELDEEPRTFRQEVSDLIEYGPSVAKDIFSEVIGKPLVGAAAAEKAYDLGLPAELIDDAAAYGRSVADYKPSPEVRAYEQRLKRGIVDLLQSDTAQFLAPLAKPILESLGEISEGVVEGGVGLQSLLRGETDEEKRRELERANRPALEAISPI